MSLARSLLVIVAMASTVLAQEVMPPPVDMVHDGVPPVPTSVFLSFVRYETPSEASLVGWDAARPEPIITVDSHQAAIVRTPGEPPDIFSRLPDGCMEIYYEPGGKYLLYEKAAGKHSQAQIYRYDIEAKAITLLTDGESRNRYPIWSNSGK